MAHAVVFGGGGVLGISWEIGVVAGLLDEGVDPLAAAATVVGTSAGSVVGARLAAGAVVPELVEEQVGAVAGDDAVTAGTVFGLLDHQLLADIFVRWTSTFPMTAEVAREVGELSLKQSTIDEEAFIALIGVSLAGAAWPDRGLRVVTSSCAPGARTVWTERDGVALGRAVAASCAIPGIMPPVAVDPGDGERHIDGGVWSGTNADLLVDDEHDAVLVIEAMSASANQLGALSARFLAAERAALEAAGTRVHVVSADSAYGALSLELLDPAKRPLALELGRATGRATAAAVQEHLAPRR